MRHLLKAVDAHGCGGRYEPEHRSGITTWLHLMPRVPVTDMERSITYYQEALGLRLAWRHSAGLAALASWGIEVLLLEPWAEDGPPPRLSAYVYVEDPDALCEECLQTGCDIVAPIASRASGMRDFTVRDPDGHVLTFGKAEERLREVAHQYGLAADQIAVEPKWLEDRKSSR